MLKETRRLVLFRIIIVPKRSNGFKFFLNFAKSKQHNTVKRILYILLVALVLPSDAYGRQDSLRHSWREAENYTRFAPYAVVGGLKLAGVKGRYSWGRMTASTAMANVIMAGSTYALKHAVSETRPDNSDRHSFPSGHTATAFAAATVLHREYGLTLSPWISAGGYAIATGTGMLRVAHNQHWAGDVMAGAAIGILSTELGYWLGDLIFRDKGIEKGEMDDMTNPEHPSFVDVEMGVGANRTTLCFYPAGTMTAESVRLGTRTTASIEAAYFYNKYVGTGGMARIISTPIDGENMLDASLDAGLYLNLPLCKRLSIGSKALAGVRLSGSANVRESEASTTTMPGEAGASSLPGEAGASTKATARLDADNTMNYVVGLNCTWRYKENCAWKVFADLDSSRKNFTLTSPNLGSAQNRATLNQWTVGGAFSVCF